MARILVAEQLAESGLARMREAGHDVEVHDGLSPDELATFLPDAAALVVRSATKVTADVLDAGGNLVVVGRAGVGLDNIDVAAATARGVMVVNAPESSVVSAAEHTMALLLALARHVAAAHASLTSGRWERSRYEGVELHGKTLGILGLGRIGSRVAALAQAFGMETIGHDPYVSPERATAAGVRLLPLIAVVEQADFLTLHLPRTPETTGLVGAELLGRAKEGVRIVNAARGGVLDEAALYRAIVSGRVAGAALDVFAREPCTDSPLFELPQVLVTPHLGASTEEAQDKAGEQIAEQVVLALAGEPVPYAVNLPAAPASEAVRPYLGLAERLGRCLVAMTEGLPPRLEVACSGALASEETTILTLSVLRGIFSAASDGTVSYLRASMLARERGLEVVGSSSATSRDYVSLVTVRGGGHSVAGTLTGASLGTERLVSIDDHSVDLPLAENFLAVRNDDRPGMVGVVGTALGEAGVSIVSMAVGQSPVAETALMALATDRPVPPGVLERLRASDGILSAHRLLVPHD